MSGKVLPQCSEVPRSAVTSLSSPIWPAAGRLRGQISIRLTQSSDSAILIQVQVGAAAHWQLTRTRIPCSRVTGSVLGAPDRGRPTAELDHRPGSLGSLALHATRRDRDVRVSVPGRCCGRQGPVRLTVDTSISYRRGAGDSDGTAAVTVRPRAGRTEQQAATQKE